MTNVEYRILNDEGMHTAARLWITFCLSTGIFAASAGGGELEWVKVSQDKRGFACGWIGFYWGKTPEEYRHRGRIGDVLILGWLEFFKRTRPGN
jgi:hypothetical protein